MMSCLYLDVPMSINFNLIFTVSVVLRISLISPWHMILKSYLGIVLCTLYCYRRSRLGVFVFFPPPLPVQVSRLCLGMGKYSEKFLRDGFIFSDNAEQKHVQYILSKFINHEFGSLHLKAFI